MRVDKKRCPRPDSNGHALTGTGPQPAAYTNSATGARSNPRPIFAFIIFGDVPHVKFGKAGERLFQFIQRASLCLRRSRAGSLGRGPSKTGMCVWAKRLCLVCVTGEQACVAQKGKKEGVSLRRCSRTLAKWRTPRRDQLRPFPHMRSAMMWAILPSTVPKLKVFPLFFSTPHPTTVSLVAIKLTSVLAL